MKTPRPIVVKADDALRTIGEMAGELGVGPHVLRYWEGKFPQLRPMQRAGGRRYYRPADAALLRRIHRALNAEGYTIKGVQRLLAGRERGEAPVLPAPAASAVPLTRLIDLRDRLMAALHD